jgi:hypothetical protein
MEGTGELQLGDRRWRRRSRRVFRVMLLQDLLAEGGIVITDSLNERRNRGWGL